MEDDGGKQAAQEDIALEVHFAFSSIKWLMILQQ